MFVNESKTDRKEKPGQHEAGLDYVVVLNMSMRRMQQRRGKGNLTLEANLRCFARYGHLRTLMGRINDYLGKADCGARGINVNLDLARI